MQTQPAILQKLITLLHVMLAFRTILENPGWYSIFCDKWKSHTQMIFFLLPRQFHRIIDCRDFLVYNSRARRRLWFINLFLAWFLASFFSGFKPAHNNELSHFQSNRHHNDIAMAYLPKLYNTSAFPMLVALLMQAGTGSWAIPTD